MKTPKNMSKQLHELTNNQVLCDENVLLLIPFNYPVKIKNILSNIYLTYLFYTVAEHGKTFVHYVLYNILGKQVGPKYIIADLAKMS